MDKELLSAVQCLPDALKQSVLSMPKDVTDSLLEIRLRAGKPLLLYLLGGLIFPLEGGRYSRLFPDKTPVVSADDISHTVTALCGGSVYSHTEEINAGYIAFAEGIRAGVCGTAATESGGIVSVRDIRCVNIRVSRNINGCAADIASLLFDGGLKSAVIFGPPLSGKTTVLKDIARILSSYPRYHRTVLVDERRELVSAEGINLDVFEGYPKALGIEYAVRAFSPDVIICDELGTQAETDAVLKAVGCGVQFIVSVHCGSLSELMRRPLCRQLVQCGAFDAFVFLPGLGKPLEFFSGKELVHEDSRCSDDTRCIRDMGISAVLPPVAQSR